MCQNHMCRARKECYRYMAVPNEEWQAYGNFGRKDNKKCHYFWNGRVYIRERK